MKDANLGRYNSSFMMGSFNHFFWNFLMRRDQLTLGYFDNLDNESLKKYKKKNLNRKNL
jgi:hypothetical protein